MNAQLTTTEVGNTWRHLKKHMAEGLYFSSDRRQAKTRIDLEDMQLDEDGDADTDADAEADADASQDADTEFVQRYSGVLILQPTLLGSSDLPDPADPPDPADSPYPPYLTLDTADMDSQEDTPAAPGTGNYPRLILFNYIIYNLSLRLWFYYL